MWSFGCGNYARVYPMIILSNSVKISNEAQSLNQECIFNDFVNRLDSTTRSDAFEERFNLPPEFLTLNKVGLEGTEPLFGILTFSPVTGSLIHLAQSPTVGHHLHKTSAR